MTKEMYTPPQIKIVEFGNDDDVLCSSVPGGITVGGGGVIDSGDGEDVWA